MTMSIVIALTISAAAQTGFGKDALLDLPVLAQRDLGLEAINFAAPILANLPLKFVFPTERHGTNTPDGTISMGDIGNYRRGRKEKAEKMKAESGKRKAERGRKAV